MKRHTQPLLLVFTAVLAMSLSACDSNSIAVSGGETPAPAAQAMNTGDWQMSGPFISGAASIAGSGNSLTLTVLLPAQTPNGSCGASRSPSVLTGAVSGSTVTFTSPSLVAGGNEIMTITGIARYGTNLEATFQVTGAKSTDACYGAAGRYGAAGLASGSYVPPPTGTWAGTVTETDNDPIGNGFILSYPLYVSTTLTEATTPDANVRFPLSGTITFSGSACFPEGAALTIDSSQSFMIGNQISLSVVDFDDGEILFADKVPSSERSNGPNPFYSLEAIPGAPDTTETQGTMSFSANTADNQIYSGACGFFEWDGTLLNPPAPVVPTTQVARQ